MESYAERISFASPLPSHVTEQLVNSGFATIPGPLHGNRFEQMVAAYDEVMGSASGPDFRIGSTTTRMSDLLSCGSGFDDLFVYPPLLEACRHVIGEPFKLSSLLGRTLRAGMRGEELHADLPRDSADAPLLGFILMIDPFRKENGATRFVSGSHRWPDLPSDRRSDTLAACPGEILGCGDAGTLLLFNGAIWHGHTANVTAQPRRSVQGYFVRRNARSGFDFRNRLPPAARNRMSLLPQYLLDLCEGDQHND